MTTATDARTTIVSTLLAEAESAMTPSAVRDDTPLDATGLALNSLGFVRAMVTLEDRFGIELDEAVVMASEFSDVGDVVRFVVGALEGRAP